MDKHHSTQVGRVLKELGVQMIPAYSPQVRGARNEFQDLAGASITQELRLAGTNTPEAANRFLREHLVDVFNRKFTVLPEQKASAFRLTSRSDLDCIFSVQIERMVAKDNTVAICNRVWQIEQSRFRGTLAGCSVTIHEHLNGAGVFCRSRTTKLRPCTVAASVSA